MQFSIRELQIFVIWVSMSENLFLSAQLTFPLLVLGLSQYYIFTSYNNSLDD